MNKRSKIIGLVLGALVLGSVVLVGLWSREPSYRGRTLRSWLEQYSDAPLDEVQGRAEAEAAIREIGEERAVRRPPRMECASLAALVLAL